MTYTRIPTLTLAAGGLALIAACTDPGAVGGADPYGKTKTGAAIGGLTGAAAGAVIADKSLKGAVIGGVAGAAAGGLIGNILDRQAADLQRDMNNSDVTITNTGDRLVVNMPQSILFATDSASLSPSIQDELYAVARNLNQYPDSTVRVVGHTDNTGSADYNQSLSQRRALSVENVLEQGGVSPGRIQAIGAGEDQPVASNLTEDGKARNRRVEIVIIPTAA